MPSLFPITFAATPPHCLAGRRDRPVKSEHAAQNRLPGEAVVFNHRRYVQHDHGRQRDARITVHGEKEAVNVEICYRAREVDRAENGKAVLQHKESTEQHHENQQVEYFVQQMPIPSRALAAYRHRAP